MKRPLLVAIIIVAVVIGSGWYLLLRNGTETRYVSGTIETDEVQVASRYGGRIEALFADEGDALTNGQLIAELAAPELLARRAQAAAMLEQLKNGPRREDIEASRHEWEALQADLEFARLDEARAKDLFEQKTVSESERDRAVARRRSLEQNVSGAKSRHDLLVAGTRREEIERAQAELSEIEVHIGELRIVAPTNCVLEVLPVKAGDVAGPNRTIATLILSQHLWVRVYVPQTWLGFIKTGQSVTVRVDPFPDREFDGVVEQINREAEFTPRNVQTQEERVKQVFGVKVRFANPDGSLRPGISADVYFPDVPPQPR